MGAVTLNDNNAKLDNLEKAIRAANERRRKLIEKNKLITYSTIADLYGLEGQELIDAVTAEHALIDKLSASGMTYEQIAELADSGSADTVGQQMFFSEKKNPYED
ncbi:MAG: hypothetical protein ACI4RG_02040 [Huintestinicola sp.]